ncbi:MAG: domain S-box-containing protein [Myxococcales bacterium]|nr:domain S-box-containing protein [Myxococcales bacterium]
MSTAERYRKLFESCPLPVFIFDRGALALREANDAAVKAYGIDRSVLFRTTIIDLGFPRDLADLPAGVNVVRRAGAAGAAPTVEVRCRDLEEEGGLARLVIANDQVADPSRAEFYRLAEMGLRSVLNNAPIVLAFIDGDGRFEFVEGRILREVGIDPQMLTGRSSIDLFAATPMFDPDGRPTTTVQLFERLRAGERVVMLAQLGDRWIETRYETVAASDGRVGRIVSVSLDVTDRRNAEAALAAGEERFHALVENSSDAIKTADARGVITYASASTTRVLGYGSGELVGMSVFELVHPDDLDQLRSTFANCLSKPGVPITSEVRYRHQDGSYVDLEAVRINRLDDPNLHCIVTNYRDISAAKQLRLEHERFFAMSYDLLAITGTDGRFRRVNPSFGRVLGYSTEELLSKSFLDFVHPDDVQSTLEETDKLAVGATALAFRNRYRTKGGDHRWLSWAAVPEPSTGLVYSVGRDVTDVMLLEQQLAHSQKMDAIGRLAGGIAHDFNNMLSVIVGVSEAAIGELRREDPLRADFEDIFAAGTRAATLTRQLLAFSKRQMLQPKVVDVNGLIRETERVLGRMLGEDVELHLALADEVADVKIDAGQFDQVLVNLVVNARDAMPDGGRLTIETSNVVLDDEYARLHVGVRSGSYVMIAVSDTGVGMDAATKARIFEPFFTTKCDGRGTGLGLATVFGIVHQSGGHIWVYSEPAHGTCFKVYVPVTAELRGGPPSAESGKATGGHERILVVEDETMVRLFVKRVLEHAGYEVLEAANGGEALRLVESQPNPPVDLLLTDVIMPRMSGRQLADRLRAMLPTLRVLYMSGYTENAIIRHGVLDDGIAYMQKPVTASSLLPKVRELLSG